MILKDFHTHTFFSDGADSPEDMVKSALSLGLSALGISDHSPAPYDDAAMKPGKLNEYLYEIKTLKEKYADKLKIKCGIEEDFFANLPGGLFDYKIGSVHYIKVRENYLSIDAGANEQVKWVNEFFGGDFLSYVEAYYETVSEIFEKTKCNIIGHFDIVTKFNDEFNFFDENSERYKAAWKKAVDTLIPCKIPFEINTKAVLSKKRKYPYPAPEIIDYIKSKGGHFILSSDSHRKDTICYGFEKYSGYLNL